MSPKREKRMSDLFDYVVKKANGFTIPEAVNDLDMRREHVRLAVYDLRRVFLADDQINIVCQPENGRAAWTYRLVGTQEQAEFWTRNRTDDAETRLVTIASVCRSIVNATDGRSSDGRRARIILRHVERAREDLAEIQ
jgi:hypothetical protein